MVKQQDPYFLDTDENDSGYDESILEKRLSSKKKQELADSFSKNKFSAASMEFNEDNDNGSMNFNSEIKAEFDETSHDAEKLKIKMRKDQMKFLNNVGPDKNSMLFVNDRKHARHKKRNPHRNDEPVDMSVKLSQIYETDVKDRQFISEDMQGSLNNDYDYAITQMFRIFIKQDEIYPLPPTQKQEQINDFFSSCQNVIYTFIKLKKAVFTAPESDFKILREIETNKEKKDDKNLLGDGFGMLGDGVGAIGSLGAKTFSGAGTLMKKGYSISKNTIQSQGQFGSFEKNINEEKPGNEQKITLQKKESSMSPINNSESGVKPSRDLERRVSMFHSLTGAAPKDEAKTAAIKIVRQRARIQKFQTATIQTQKKKCQQESKFMFFLMAFKESELHEMFKDFYEKFMKDPIIEKQDLISFIEIMCQPDYITQDVMQEKILPVMGVQKGMMDQLDMLNKETKINGFHLSIDIHQKVFEQMNEGNSYVKFTKMLPYLMIFFLIHLNTQLDKRLTNFKDILDPNQKTSLFNCFLRAGLKPLDFERKCISYRQVEEAVIDFRSCYPNSFDFDQMNIILRMVRERMQVDDFSHIEDIKESFYKHNLSKQIMNGQDTRAFNNRSQTNFNIQRNLSPVNQSKFSYEDKSATIAGSQMDLQKKKTKSVKMLQNTQIISTKHDSTTYSIHHDNDGLGKWLAVNIGLQMMWHQITENQKELGNEQDEFVHGYDNKNQFGDYYRFRDPFKKFKDTFKLYFEERLWFLAKLHFDKQAFEFLNFNQIVKKTLIDKLKTQDHKYQQQSKDMTGIQPYLGVLPSLMKMGQIISQLGHKPDASNPNSPGSSPRQKSELNSFTETQKTETLNINIKNRIIFTITDYIESLWQVMQKNFYSHVEYANVELAVFNYIQNLCHKCESILMDQLEYYQIDKNKKAEDDLQINARLKRIYGMDHESVHKEKQAGTIGLDINLNPLNLGGKMVNMVGNTAGMSKTTKEWLLDNKTAVKNKHDRLIGIGVDKKELKIEIGAAGDLLMGGMKSMADKTKQVGGGISGGMANFNQQMKAKMKKSIHIHTEAQIIDDGLKHDAIVDLTNNVIDDIFIDDASHPFIKEIKDQKDITELDDLIFQEKKQGINLFSKSENKHMFRLLQIFGFRNEPLLSFIDKDHMKIRFNRAMNKNKYPNPQNPSDEEPGFLEYFLVSYGIQHLAKWREDNLGHVFSFRKLILQTYDDIRWTTKLEEEQYWNDDRYILEANQDIFNFSWKIISEHSTRIMTRYGTNINLINGIPRQTFEITEGQFSAGIQLQEKEKIQKHFENVSQQIVRNEQLFRRHMQQDDKEIVFQFIKRRSVFLNAAEDQAQKELEQIQDAITQKDYHANEKSTKNALVQNIPKSYLNVFLTAQFYTGIMGEQEDIEEKDEEVEALKQLEDQAIFIKKSEEEQRRKEMYNANCGVEHIKGAEDKNDLFQKKQFNNGTPAGFKPKKEDNFLFPDVTNKKRRVGPRIFMDDSKSDEEINYTKNNNQKIIQIERTEKGSLTKRIETPRAYKIDENACKTPVKSDRAGLLNNHGRAEIDDYQRGEMDQAFQRKKHKDIEQIHGRPHMPRKLRRQHKQQEIEKKNEKIANPDKFEQLSETCDESAAQIAIKNEMDTQMQQMIRNKPKLDKYRPDISQIIANSKKKHLFKGLIIDETQDGNYQTRQSVLPSDLKGSRGRNRSKRSTKVQKYNTSKWLETVDEPEKDDILLQAEHCVNHNVEEENNTNAKKAAKYLNGFFGGFNKDKDLEESQDPVGYQFSMKGSQKALLNGSKNSKATGVEWSEKLNSNFLSKSSQDSRKEEEDSYGQEQYSWADDTKGNSYYQRTVQGKDESFKSSQRVCGIGNTSGEEKCIMF